MGCEVFEGLLGRRLDGERVPAAEERLLDGHLASCESCRRELAGWSEDHALLVEAFASAPAATPEDAALQARLVLRRLEDSLEETPGPVIVAARRVQRPAFLLAAASALVGALLTWTWASLGREGLERDLATARGRERSLAGQLDLLREEMARERARRSPSPLDRVPGAPEALGALDQPAGAARPRAEEPAAVRVRTLEELRREIEALVQQGDLDRLLALREELGAHPELAAFLIGLSRSTSSARMKTALAQLLKATKGPEALRFFQEELEGQLLPGAPRDDAYRRALVDGLSHNPNASSLGLLRRLYEGGDRPPEIGVQRAMMGVLEQIEGDEANRLLTEMARNDPYGDHYSIRAKALETLIRRAGSPAYPGLAGDTQFQELLQDTAQHILQEGWLDAGKRAIDFLSARSRSPSVDRLLRDLHGRAPPGTWVYDYLRERLR